VKSDELEEEFVNVIKDENKELADVTWVMMSNRTDRCTNQSISPL
jgi:GTPase SAR1 family protein